MAYRIEYDCANQKFEIHTQSKPSIFALTAGAFSAFLLLTILFWQEGREVLRDLCIPGDDAVTLHALEQLSVQVKAGTPVSEALTCFCREILYGA